MNIVDRVLSVIAPHECLACGTEGSVLCAECAEAELPFLPTGICFLCGKLSANFKTCLSCAKTYTPEHVWMTSKYEGVAKDVVSAYKFAYKRSAAQILARYMDASLPYFAEPPLLTFVPTLPQHVRARGFDHAALLTKELARLRGWRYEPLIVRQHKGQQHGASRQSRQEQIKGAFRARNPARIAGSHILLVDDVTTTGSTLKECSKVLKKAGASQVDAVVFARTPEK